LVRVQPGELTPVPGSEVLRVGDSNATEGLIQRFRFLLAHHPNVSQAQHDAVKSYDNRLIGISRLQGKIQQESTSVYRTCSASGDRSWGLTPGDESVTIDAQGRRFFLDRCRDF
jgi:hypothetical protein